MALLKERTDSMKLNHINLPVRDVAAARDFMARYFGLVTMMEVGKNFLVMQQDDTGLVLNISHFDKSDTAEVVYHRDFHVGFFVDSAEEVDRVYAQFTADSVAVEPPRQREGRYGFYVNAPGGFVVEVSQMT
jgi:lactoylglutathione lyase